LDNKVKSINISNEESEKEKKLIKVTNRFCSDCFENKYTPGCIFLSCSGVVNAVDCIMSHENKINNVFCNVRPPGHHSKGKKECNASGFCFINNVAVATKYLLDK